MILHARGIEHHSNGVNNVLSYINIVLATGKDRFARTRIRHDHGTGKRSRRTRTRTKMRSACPGRRSIIPKHRKYISEVWGIEESEMPQAGVSVVEMFEKMREGEIKGLTFDLQQRDGFAAGHE